MPLKRTGWWAGPSKQTDGDGLSNVASRTSENQVSIGEPGNWKVSQKAASAYTDKAEEAVKDTGGGFLAHDPHMGTADINDVYFILENWKYFRSKRFRDNQDMLGSATKRNGGPTQAPYWNGFKTDGTTNDSVQVRSTLEWIFGQMVVGGQNDDGGENEEYLFFDAVNGPRALMGVGNDGKNNIFGAKYDEDTGSGLTTHPDTIEKGSHAEALARLYYKIKNDMDDSVYSQEVLEHFEDEIDQRFKEWKPENAALWDAQPGATKQKFIELITEHVKLYEKGEIPNNHLFPKTEQVLRTKGSSKHNYDDYIVLQSYNNWHNTDALQSRVRNDAFILRSLPYVTREYFKEPLTGMKSRGKTHEGYPLIGSFFKDGGALIDQWTKERISYTSFEALQKKGIGAGAINCKDKITQGIGAQDVTRRCWLQMNSTTGDRTSDGISHKRETYTPADQMFGGIGVIFGSTADASTPVLPASYVPDKTSADDWSANNPVYEANLHSRMSRDEGAINGWIVPEGQTLFTSEVSNVAGFSPKAIVEVLTGKKWSTDQYWIDLGKSVDESIPEATIKSNVEVYKGYYDEFMKMFNKTSVDFVGLEITRRYNKIKKEYEEAVAYKEKYPDPNAPVPAPSIFVRCAAVDAALHLGPWMFWVLENMIRIGSFCELAFRANVLDQPAEDVDGAAIAALQEGEVLDAAADSIADISLEQQLAEADKLSQDEIKNRQKLLKQCALMTNMEMLKNDYRAWIGEKAPLLHAELKQGGKWAPFQYRFHNIDTLQGERSAIMNKLILPMHEQIKPFLDITPEVHACLVPKIRLFKVFNNFLKGHLDEVEILFENQENAERISSLEGAAFDKGNGAGIKEFSFSFEGSNPATSRNDIKANLTMFFQSFNDFIKKRTICKGSDPACSYRYVDLVLFPVAASSNTVAGYGHSAKFSYDPSYYRIRADVGWQIRSDEEFNNILNARGGKDAVKFKEALKKVNKSFYLNMVDHELDIRPDGTVEMKIAYRAYLESVMKSPALDALATPAVQKVRKDFNNELDKVMSSEICSNDQIADLMAAYGVIEDTLIKRAYQSIMERLIARRRIFYADFEKKDMDDFARMGFFTRRPRFVGEPANVREASKAGEFAASGKSESGRDFKIHNNKVEDFNPPDIRNTEVRVNYFHLGDLLYTVMDCMYLQDGVKMNPAVDRTKLLLGSFNYDTLIGSETTQQNANIADIPISTEYFYEWFTQNVVKSKRKSYPIMNFVRDLCNGLVVESLGEVCFNKQLNKKMRFQTGNFLAVAPGGDPFVSMNRNKNYFIDVDKHYGPKSSKKLPLNQDAENDISINQMYNYVVVYPVTAPTFHKGNGDFVEDGAQGIYHYEIGANRGLLKNVKFAKTDMQYIREARFFRNGFDGLMQLGAVYKITMDMIGNTLYYPGMEVYLDPRGIGGQSFDPTIGPSRNQKASVANALGFGGYHIITRVNSVIAPGSFKTTVDAQFHYSGDGNLGGARSQEAKGGNSSRRNNSTPGKNPDACERVLSRRSQDATQLFDNPGHELTFPISDSTASGQKISDIIGTSDTDSNPVRPAELLDHSSDSAIRSGNSSDPSAESSTLDKSTGQPQTQLTLEEDPKIKSEDSAQKTDPQAVKKELEKSVDDQSSTQTNEGVTKRYGPGELTLQGGRKVTFDYGIETDISIFENRVGKVEQFYKLRTGNFDGTMADLVFEGERCNPGEGDASTAAACGYRRRQGSGGIQAYSGRYINMEGGGKQ